MAKCKICKQNMLASDTCTERPVSIGGTIVNRIRYGDEKRANFSEHSERCHDCGISVGAFHHFNCDVEECPVCHGQLLICRHDVP